MMKINWQSLCLIFLLAFVPALVDAKIQKCLKASETGRETGPLNQRKKTDECCQGLKKIEVKETCGKALGGSFQFVCAECGDQKCDSQIENSCNCPEDCD